MGIRIKQQNGMHNVKVKNPVQQSDIIVHTTGTSASVKANDNTDDLAIGLAKDWAIKTDGTVNGAEYSSKYYALLAQEFVNETMVPATSTKLGVVKVGNKLSVTEDGTLSANTYSTEELNSLLLEKADVSDIPTYVSELNNDLDYVTQVELNNQLANYTAPLAPATSSTLGGVKIGSGINVSSDGTISVSTRNIGEIVSSTLPLTDAGLHLLDGALIQGDGIYSAFVDYIAGLVSTYPSIFTTESAWQSSVSTYGVCGKFVYDSTNNTVRLPKYGTQTITKTPTASTVPLSIPVSVNVYGNGKTLGLTANGSDTFSIGYRAGYDNTASVGSYNATLNSTFNSNNGTDTRATYRLGVSMSANNSGLTGSGTCSGSINLANALTNYPLDCYYYIVIATSTKTDIQVDIDNVVTDLNGKADTDLTNVTDMAKVLMSGMGMPSDRYIDLTLGASGTTYTAPANGYFSILARSANTVRFDGLRYNVTMPDVSGSLSGVIFPILKGKTIALSYGTLDLSDSWNYFRFIYAKGSVSEV